MALVVDASSPARVTNAALTATTASFNPPDNSVLVACVGLDGLGPQNATLSNNGTALTWTQILARNFDSPGSTSHGGVAASYAILLAGRTGMTVTSTRADGLANDTSLKLYVVTGADTTTPLGGSTAGSSTTSPVTTSGFTTVGASSMGFMLANDFGVGTSSTSSDTTFDSYFVSTQLSGGSGYKTLSTAGSSATFNYSVTETTGREINWGTFEIKAGSAPAVGDPLRIPIQTFRF